MNWALIRDIFDWFGSLSSDLQIKDNGCMDIGCMGKCIAEKVY